jgi:glycosyltransferase involved in cell wall biosynthesis
LTASADHSRRPKVLVSAYACEPGTGSEPGAGWEFVRSVSRFADLWVLTRRNNGNRIEAALAQDPTLRIHPVYVDLPRWVAFWKKKQRGIRLYYYLWQLRAYFVARRLNRRVRFDLAHHVTFGIYWMPSFLALMRLPFVWGPLGGGESAPRPFWGSFSFRGRAYEVLRDLARALARVDPFIRFTARRATLALATTPESESSIRRLGCERVLVFPQAGLGGEEIGRLGLLAIRREKPFRVLSLGRLLHWKGFELGLRAFALLHERFPDSEYWLIGEGPERARLARLALKLGVAKHVTFWGSVSRSTALDKLAACDVLVHPSLHDSSPAVCVEAMAAGRPVVCLNLGGPAVQVTKETGIRVSAQGVDQAIQDLAAAFLDLAQHQDFRVSLGEAAREHVMAHFDWDKKALQISEIYERLARMDLIGSPVAPTALDPQPILESRSHR